MRFHILGIPHSISNKEFSCCPFTSKLLNLSDILMKKGHEVYHYGHELSEVNCTEHITVVSDKEYKQTYGEEIDHSQIIEFDHNQDYAYKLFHLRASQEIRDRAKKDDFILCFYGWGHQPVAAKLVDLPVHIVEPGVGYTDTFAAYRIFESYSKMHFQMGVWDQAYRAYDSLSDEAKKEIHFRPNQMIAQNMPQWQDAVISNGFDLNDFNFQEEKEDYLFFVGRIIKDKGIEEAIKLAKETDHKLLVAGPGDFRKNLGYNIPEHVEFLGSIGIEERNKLMGKAKAGLCLSYYPEPLCYVAIEFQLCGTPVIASDFGGFTETILHGITGYRVRTLRQGIWAINNIDKIQPSACRQWTEDNYSIERIGDKYETYFENLLLHLKDSDETENIDYKDLIIDNLDHLNRFYPNNIVKIPEKTED